MRNLNSDEVKQVCGGGDYYCPPEEDQKGNNGWGNGGLDGVPGSSGTAQPEFITYDLASEEKFEGR